MRKFDKSEVFRRAHELKKFIFPERTFGECLKQAWSEAKELRIREQQKLELDRIRKKALGICISISQSLSCA